MVMMVIKTLKGREMWRVVKLDLAMLLESREALEESLVAVDKVTLATYR